MTLKESTTTLLRKPDIAHWLKVADTHIQAFNKMPNAFVLPAEHAIVKPIIEHFAGDATAFAEYIRALRDATDGAAYDELHDLYRTISVRALQVVRRTRIRKAVLLLLPELEALLGRATNYDEQTVIGKVIEQVWGEARLNVLTRERNALTSKRIPTEERAAILDAYWADIDKQLAKGKVPLGDATLQDLLGGIK